MVAEEVSIRYAAVVKQNQYLTDSFFVDHAMLARPVAGGERRMEIMLNYLCQIRGWLARDKLPYKWCTVLIGLTAYLNKGHKGENENHHPQFNLHKKIMERKNSTISKQFFKSGYLMSWHFGKLNDLIFSVRNLFYDPEYDLIN